jgi:hypothetical protein
MLNNIKNQNPNDVNGLNLNLFQVWILEFRI